MSESPTVTYEPRYRDIVWAKMKPWRPWPGKVIKVPKGEKVPVSKRNSKYIFFYGTNNCGWVPRDNIWPFEEFKEKYSQNTKGKEDFADGVKIAEEKLEARKRGEISGSDEEEEDDASSSSSATAGSDIFPSRTDSDKPKPKKRKLASGRPKKDVGLTSPKKANLSEAQTSKKSGTKPTASTSSHDLDSSGESLVRSKKALESNSVLKKHSVGVLGLGVLGSEVAARLLEADHRVTVWNRTEAKCADFVKMGAVKGDSPGEVFKNCDITLVCASSAEAVKNIVFMEKGLNSSTDKGCNLVVLTMMNPEPSLDIEDFIVNKGGRYLEAPVHRLENDSTNFTVLAAGDEGLFKDYESVFRSFAKHCFFLGPTGMASRAALIVNSFMGSMVAGMAEAFCLAERTGVMQSELLHMISVSPLHSQFFAEKGKAMIDRDFTSRIPLQRVMEGMKDALNMSAQSRHSMPIAAVASEMFVAASAMNCGERDVSSVYMPARY